MQTNHLPSFAILQDVKAVKDIYYDKTAECFRIGLVLGDDRLWCVNDNFLIDAIFCFAMRQKWDRMTLFSNMLASIDVVKAKLQILSKHSCREIGELV